MIRQEEQLPLNPYWWTKEEREYYFLKQINDLKKRQKDLESKTKERGE